ncbi:MAG: DinB family protein [Niastella sp.]|nr:DinB family protein [Niastella sp.]
MFFSTIHQTSLLAQLQDMAAYNLWAISRLTDWLSSKPAVLLEATAASSFPGIKATLLHMLDVEREWLDRLQPMPVSKWQEADKGLGAVLDALEEQAGEWNDYVQSLSDEELQEDCYCNAFFGEVCRPKYEIIQHCLNHSTYHRGQVVTIGHQLGLKDAPMTDYLYYVLKVKEPATARREQPVGSYSQKSFLAVNFFSK